MTLRCPVCGSALAPNDAGLCCPAGHSFDRAREGYVNLLLSHQRKSMQAGDTPEMVQARRAFFAAGHYQPLIEAVTQQVRVFKPGSVLDAGCGTGECLAAIHAADSSVAACGMDISKPAIRASAKAYPGISWLVANTMREWPVMDDSVDLVLNSMAPRSVSECARVLRSEGRLVMVVPGLGHLESLQARIMDRSVNPVDKAARAIENCRDAFVLQDRVTLAFECRLENADIAHVIGMTPLAWKAKRSAVDPVLSLEHLTVEARFILLVFDRKS